MLQVNNIDETHFYRKRWSIYPHSSKIVTPEIKISTQFMSNEDIKLRMFKERKKRLQFMKNFNDEFQNVYLKSKEVRKTVGDKSVDIGKISIEPW